MAQAQNFRSLMATPWIMVAMAGSWTMPSHWPRKNNICTEVNLPAHSNRWHVHFVKVHCVLLYGGVCFFGDVATDSEKTLMRASGQQPVSLSPSILNILFPILFPAVQDRCAHNVPDAGYATRVARTTGKRFLWDKCVNSNVPREAGPGVSAVSYDTESGTDSLEGASALSSSTLCL